MQLVLIDYGEGLLHFKPKGRAGIGEVIKGYGALPNGEKLKLVVHVLQRKPDGVYLGRVDEPQDSIDKLEQTFLPDPTKSKEQMFYKPDPTQSTRHMRTYAIRSSDFPKFKGVTAELSVHSAKVILQGELPAGKVLQADLDLEDDRAPLRFQARVEWCKQRDKRTWVASLELSNLSEEDERDLRYHLAALKVNPALDRPEEE